MRSAASFVAAVLAICLSGCGGKAKAPRGSGDFERGRQVYLATCIACHHRDPAQEGTQGPPVLGSSLELIEARVVRGEYPPGYAAKRKTSIMKPVPSLEPDIPDLAAYLKAPADSVP